MNTCHFRGLLFGGASKVIFGTIAAVALNAQAQASSICTVGNSASPQTFSCFDDTVEPTATATGTFSDGASFTTDATGRVQISSDSALSVALDGQVNSTNHPTQGLTSAVYLSAVGSLNYTNNGTTSGASTGWLFNTYLRSNEAITASTGTVTAEGYRVTGVFSETINGNVTLTGGDTTVTGVWSRGIWSDAVGGQNITNTGTVNATGTFSRAVIARALPAGECIDSPGGLSTTVNVTGNVSAEYVGITTLTCGASTVNVAAGRTVSVSGNDGIAILNIGLTSANTNIDGNVLAASASGRALDVRDGASATVIGATGNMLGTFDGDAHDDSIVIMRGGQWTSSGTSDFGGGSDSLSNAGKITVNASTFVNLDVLTNNGVLAISGGSFTLTGSTNFTNNGTIQVAQGETTITSNSALNNNGTIDMQNGFAGDVLTISNNYIAGANAAILMDVSRTASDMFVVNGASKTALAMGSAEPSADHGTTQIFFNAPAEINTTAILIGVSQKGFNFTVGNQATRLIDLKLDQVGDNVYLSAIPNADAFAPLLVGQVVRDNWFQSANVYSANAALHRRTSDTTRGNRHGLWGQIYAGRESYGERSTQSVFGSDYETDNRARTDRTGVQIGFELGLGNSLGAGVTAGYEKAKAGHRSLAGGVKSQGYNLGVFAHFGRETGFFGNLLAKYDWSDVKLTNNAFDQSSADPDSKSVGAEVGAGYRWKANGVHFGLGGSLAYVRTTIDSFSAEGIDYDYRSTKSLRGSLDARAELELGSVMPFLSARLLREFDGDGSLALASGLETDSVELDGKRTWLKLEAGISGGKAFGPNLSAWAELGDVKGFGVRAGWRF